MTVNEESRYALHGKLEAVLGVEDANTLMEHLPPATWSDLARQRDIDMMRIDLRSEMATMGADLRREMTELRSELRGEMVELRNELRQEMTQLATELRGEMADLRNELRRDINRSTGQLIGTVMGLQTITLTVIGIMLSVMR